MYLLIGDGTLWLVATKDAVMGPTDGYTNDARDVRMSSRDSNPHTVKWYNRYGSDTDPWISLTDHDLGQNILYGGAAFGGYKPTVRDHNGANVYIRNNGEIIKIFV